MPSSPTDSEYRPLDYRYLLLGYYSCKSVWNKQVKHTSLFTPLLLVQLTGLHQLVVSFSFSISLLQIFRLHNDHSAIYINFHTRTTHSVCTKSHTKHRSLVSNTEKKLTTHRINYSQFVSNTVILKYKLDETLSRTLPLLAIPQSKLSHCLRYRGQISHCLR